MMPENHTTEETEEVMSSHRSVKDELVKEIEFLNDLAEEVKAFYVKTYTNFCKTEGLRRKYYPRIQLKNEAIYIYWVFYPANKKNLLNKERNGVSYGVYVKPNKNKTFGPRSFIKASYSEREFILEFEKVFTLIRQRSENIKKMLKIIARDEETDQSLVKELELLMGSNH